MDTTFLSPENNKTSDPCRLVLNLTNKMNIKNKCCIIKSWHLLTRSEIKSCETVNSSCHHQPEVNNLNYLMDLFLYQIFNHTFSLSSKTSKNSC